MSVTSTAAAPVAGTSTASPPTAEGGVDIAGRANPAPANRTPRSNAATTIDPSTERRGMRRSNPRMTRPNGHSWLMAPHNETGMRPRLIKRRRVPKPISRTGPRSTSTGIR
jgi:hypothetical protein